MAEKSEVIPVDDIANDVEELKKLVEAKVWEKNFKAICYSLKSSSESYPYRSKETLFWTKNGQLGSISNVSIHQYLHFLSRKTVLGVPLGSIPAQY